MTKTKITKIAFLGIIVIITFFIIESIFSTYFGKAGLLHLLFEILKSTVVILPICILAGFGIWFIIKIALIDKFVKKNEWKIWDNIISIVITIVFLSVINIFGLGKYKVSAMKGQPFGSRFVNFYNVVCDLITGSTYDITVEEYEIHTYTDVISGRYGRTSYC